MPGQLTLRETPASDTVVFGGSVERFQQVAENDYVAFPDAGFETGPVLFRHPAAERHLQHGAAGNALRQLAGNDKHRRQHKQ
jgi:hypothetical protein